MVKDRATGPLARGETVSKTEKQQPLHEVFGYEEEELVFYAYCAPGVDQSVVEEVREAKGSGCDRVIEDFVTPRGLNLSVEHRRTESGWL